MLVFVVGAAGKGADLFGVVSAEFDAVEILCAADYGITGIYRGDGERVWDCQCGVDGDRGR